MTIEAGVETIITSDISEIMDLINDQDWVYDAMDLEMILHLSPDTNYKLVVGGKIVGTVFSLIQDEISYISFFLVEKNHRDYATSSKLGKTCLLQSKQRAGGIVVYANPIAVTAYTRSGFHCRMDTMRFEAVGCSKRLHIENDIRELFVDDLGVLHSININCYKHDRSLIMQTLFHYDEARCFACIDNHMVRGYAFVRKFFDAYIIGPLIADNDQAAYTLFMKVLDEYPGKKLLFDGSVSKITEWSQRMKLERTLVQKKPLLKKMYQGDPNCLENEELLYFIGGHHFS